MSFISNCELRMSINNIIQELGFLYLLSSLLLLFNIIDMSNWFISNNRLRGHWGVIKQPVGFEYFSYFLGGLWARHRWTWIVKELGWLVFAGLLIENCKLPWTDLRTDQGTYVLLLCLHVVPTILIKDKPFLILYLVDTDIILFMGDIMYSSKE